MWPVSTKEFWLLDCVQMASSLSKIKIDIQPSTKKIVDQKGGEG